MAIIFDLLIFTLIYYVFFFNKWRQLGRKNFIIRTIFYLYLITVFYFTLMPIFKSLQMRIFINYHAKANFIPFVDLTHCWGNYYFEIFSNIILMLPMGIFIPLLKPTRHPLFETTIKTLLFSLMIELSQYIFLIERIFDVTDLITNTLGGFIGCLIYLVFKHFNQSNIL